MSTLLPEKTMSSKVLAVTTFTGPELSLGGSSDLTTFSSLPACNMQLDCQDPAAFQRLMAFSDASHMLLCPKSKGDREKGGVKHAGICIPSHLASAIACNDCAAAVSTRVMTCPQHAKHWFVPTVFSVHLQSGGNWHDNGMTTAYLIFSNK